MRVFVSYSSRDRTFARKLVDDLASAGIATWSDLDLEVGADWSIQLEQSLAESTAVLVLISPSSLESSWVRREWSTSLARSKRVVPVLIDGADFSDLPPELAHVQAARLDDNYYDVGLARLVQGLRALEKSPEPPVADAIDMERLVKDMVEKTVDETIERRLKELGVNGLAPQEIRDGFDENLVFVVTSFREDMEPAFEAIKCAAEAAGLRAERVKDVKGDFRITETMLEMIRKAYLIVVDLTHERPNVYFELGYARGLGKKVITIVREGTDVHFDVYDWTQVRYHDSRPLEKELTERMKHELMGDGRSVSK